MGSITAPQAAEICQGVERDVICGEPKYTQGEHRDLPHIVKFSGGRSSAAMVLSMARVGALRADRRDLVLFANTTAEHSATYDFAARVCDELETEHGLPCLWYEFCTVETASRRGWTRTATYRLVRRRAYSETDTAEKPGYRDDGTAFEELASLKGMIPNRSMRICTQYLKVLPGIQLIADWLGGGPGPAHAGHHHRGRLTSEEQDAERYTGERLPRHDYIARRTFVHAQPWERPAQQWVDFTACASVGFADGPRPRSDLAGRTGDPERYITLLGLRADESQRVSRAHFESMLADGAMGSQCRHESHPAGEVIATPLADAGATKDDVSTFWSHQPYDLGIDGLEGNCVYCFMKGERTIRLLAAREKPALNGSSDGSADQTPACIDWWADIERRYAGESEDSSAGRFKFLTLRGPSYAEIAADPLAVASGGSPSLPCSCTD